MYRVVKIGDKEVPMLAMASVDIYYKQIFGEDILKIMTDEEKFDTADRVNAIQRMGFVMAKSAELRDRRQMMRLNTDSYLDWLDQFPRGDLITAFEAIQALYLGQALTESTEKKQDAG